MTTPPGWYTDPGHTGQGPTLERWWDGSTWTDYTREPQGAVASQIPPQHEGFGPPQPAGPLLSPDPALRGYTPFPPVGGSRGKPYVIGGAAAVLVAALVGGIVLLSGDGDGDGGGADQAGANPTASARTPGPGDGGVNGGGGGNSVPDPGPSGATDAAPDVVNGISLPVLDGWEAGRVGSGGAAITIGPYPCPGLPDTTCVRGGVFSRPAAGYDAKSAEGVAKEDISKNAQASYGKDPKTGKEMYGGVTSSREMKSVAVTVAGRKGYLVRWKVVTKKGDDGYVQSLVFPSPNDEQRLVLVRFGFDATKEAPPLTDMDRITQGIKALAPGSGGTGGAA
ncbi:DUF2510 domain-containing protein [Streptomyces sp. 7N604]|uniref:DUF2510 domain-containing protein n=1 Tax=Streptomyces sp. 7N604 TaxID=3457415 RepID=UPI003FD25EFD